MAQETAHTRSTAWTRRLARLAALAAILALGALLRLWQIDQLPPGFHFDESFEGLEAWRILTDPTYRPIFLPGNFGVLPINAYANALSFGLAQALGGEVGPAVMRATAAAFGLLTLLTVFGLARELQRHAPDRLSPALPWLAVAALAGMRWHIHFSRMGIEPILVPLVWSGAAWLLLRGWRTSAWWAFAGLGATLAAGMYAYQAAWFVPFIFAAAVGYFLWHARRRLPRGIWRNLALAAGVAVVGILPLARIFAEQPDLFLTRPAQVVIVGHTPSPADTGVLAATWATAKMFGPFGAPGDLDPRRNLPGAPALNLWHALPFYLGLAWAVRHSRRPAPALLLIGLVGLLLPGVLSEYAPHFHRIIGAAAPVALFIGIGLDRLIHWLRPPTAWPTRAAWLGPLLAVTLLAAGMLVSARDYFVRWAALPDLYYAFDVGLWEVGQWVAAQPADQPIYISPQGDNHPTLAFAWRAGRAPARFDGRTLFPLTADANPTAEHYVVIEHEDFRTRLLLPEIFPNAPVTHVLRDPAGQVYAQVYTRPAGTLPQRPPQHTVAVALGDGIELLGYDAQPAALQPGGSLYIQAHWRVIAPPAHGWTVFTHLVNRNGSVVVGYDSPPGRGVLPTPQWQPGWRILDEVELRLPADLPPGDYSVRMGLYQPGADGPATRLPVDPTGITLGTVTIAAP